MTTVWGESLWLSQAVPLYSPLVFGVGLLLAWRFGRSRVAAVLVGLTMLALFPNPSAGEAALGSPWEAGAVVLLAVVGALAGLKDRGVLSKLGLVQPVIVAAGVAGCWGLWRVAGPEALAWSWVPLLPVGSVRGWTGVSDAAFVVGGASLAMAVAMALRRDHPVERGLAWSLVAIFVAVRSGPDSEAASLHLMVAGLILAATVVETSYVMAFRDDLTGLPARRALWRELDEAGRVYAVGMVDIDHFKQVNDRYGHDIGDQVLRMVATKFGGVTGGGRAFRYGGEEFTVVFPATSRKDARNHLEALRVEIEQSEFSVRRRGRPRTKPKTPKARKGRSLKVSVTVSIGVAERSEKAPTAEAVVQAADRALYRAKQRGRNRVAR